MKAWLIYNIIFISGVQHSDSKFYVLYSIYLFILSFFWLCWVFVAGHGLSLVEVLRLLIAGASLVAEHGL